MAAPMVPTTATTVNYAILAKLKLVPTPIGMRTFMIKFPAALGPLLAETLRNTISQEHQEPETTEQENLFGYIFDHLVGCMTNDSSADLLAMSKICGRNGPMALLWLQRKYDPSTTASAIVTLIDIFTASLGEDVRAGLDAKKALNDTLPDNIKLSEDSLAILMLCFFPQDLSSLRDIIIEKDTIPTMEALAEKVSNTTIVTSATGKIAASRSGAFAFASTNSSKFCFNCDNIGHHRSDCTKPLADCSVCGVAAGHPDKHCLVQSTKPIPNGLSAKRRAEIEEARKAYGLKHAANLCFEIGDGSDNDENFWDMLARHSTGL